MVNRLIHKITTTKDPVIRQVCRRDSQERMRISFFFSLKTCKTHGNVFATDAIISTLMCCTRSVYPWDIVVDVNIEIEQTPISIIIRFLLESGHTVIF